MIRAADLAKAPESISEADLTAAHAAPSLLARPCACGSVVIADPRDPTEGVRLHNETPAHAAWRQWR